MKKLLLLSAVLFCFVRGVQAWNGTSFPASSFRSTSSMAGAGSSLPMAAAGGARLAGNAPQYIGGIGAARSPMDDDPFGGETVADLVKGIPERLVPVGRLDKESEGLLLMSNDGDLTLRLTHPRYEHEKRYMVKASGRWNDD